MILLAIHLEALDVEMMTNYISDSCLHWVLTPLTGKFYEHLHATKCNKESKKNFNQEAF